MKRVVIILVLLGLTALALPVVNLIVGVPENRLMKMAVADPVAARATAVMAGKCVNCHTEEFKLPFYARFPVARGIIQKDIQDGTRYLDLATKLRVPEGQPYSEVALSKIEHTLADGSMPPLRYLLLHWDGGLSDTEKNEIVQWIHAERTGHYATSGVAPRFQHNAVQPLPRSIKLDAAKVALGDRLYHDTRLSGDNTISCASCHALDKGGTDRLQFSKGIGGQVGNINSPTTFNSGYQFKQFWDGRAKDLEEQADGPVNNPVEMGTSWPAVIGKLAKDVELSAAFKKVYPDGFTPANIQNAIAEFERSLITPDSPFDLYLTGKEDAISAGARKGYALFKEHGCAMCHVGKILGGQSFEMMGRKQDYFKRRGNIQKSDWGRYNVTSLEKDRYYLKVPTLRNIAQTAPYFHDGSTSDLAAVVETMAECELDTSLSQDERDRIVEFLRTLTGQFRGKPVQ
jgi:cytochrome c peroxidase